MAEDGNDPKVSFPYMTAAQWYGVRAKLRQSLPRKIDVDWLMAALGTSEKGAKNIIPQLRAIGLVGSDGVPTEVVHDLRDDETYADACKAILASLYPDSLRDSYPDPAVDSERVASWFVRNARTGQATASMQAKLYLALLKGELPTEESQKPKAAPRRRRTVSEPPKTVTNGQVEKSDSSANLDNKVDDTIDENKALPEVNTQPPVDNGRGSTPSLHVDVQIHISADSSEDQIDTIFRSMAKHLYGRD